MTRSWTLRAIVGVAVASAALVAQVGYSWYGGESVGTDEPMGKVVFNPAPLSMPAVEPLVAQTLPLTRLPANYDAVINALGKRPSGQELTLLLREGKTIIGSGQENSPDAYDHLAQSDVPLLITSQQIGSLFERELVRLTQQALAENAWPRWQQLIVAWHESFPGYSRHLKSPGYMEAADRFYEALAAMVRGHSADSGDTQKSLLLWREDVQTLESFCKDALATNGYEECFVLLMSLKDSGQAREFASLVALTDFALGTDSVLFHAFDTAIKMHDINHPYAAPDRPVLEEVFQTWQMLLGEDPQSLSNQCLLAPEVALVLSEPYAIGGEWRDCLSDDVDLRTTTTMADILKFAAWSQENSDKPLTTYLNRMHLLEAISSGPITVPLSWSVPQDNALSDDLNLMIESDPERYARLITSWSYVRSGLAQHGVLSPEVAAQFVAGTEALETIVELTAQPPGEQPGVSRHYSLLSWLAGEVGTQDKIGRQPLNLLALAEDNSTPFELTWKPSYLLSVDRDGQALRVSVIDVLPPEVNVTYPRLPQWMNYLPSLDNFDKPVEIAPLEQARGTVRIPVLMYHHIDTVPDNNKKRFYVDPAMFEEQLAYLSANGYRTLTPQEFSEQLSLGSNPTQKSVLLTFDDSPQNNFDFAYPLLNRYGYTGTFYTVSRRSSFSGAELAQMTGDGMVIGSHTQTHIDLQKEEDDARLYNEIVVSRLDLMAQSGQEINSIAYPGCVADAHALQYVGQAGYALGFSCGKSIDHSNHKRLTLSRLHAYNDMHSFKMALAGVLEVPEGQ